MIPNEKILKKSFLIKFLCNQILRIKGYQPIYSKKIKKINKNKFPVILNKVLTHGQKKYEKFYDDTDVLVNDKHDKSYLKIDLKYKINPNKIVSNVIRFTNIKKIIIFLKKEYKKFQR